MLVCLHSGTCCWWGNHPTSSPTSVTDFKFPVLGTRFTINIVQRTKHKFWGGLKISVDVFCSWMMHFMMIRHSVRPGTRILYPHFPQKNCVEAVFGAAGPGYSLTLICWNHAQVSTFKHFPIVDNDDFTTCARNYHLGYMWDWSINVFFLGFENGKFSKFLP